MEDFHLGSCSKTSVLDKHRLVLRHVTLFQHQSKVGTTTRKQGRQCSGLFQHQNEVGNTTGQQVAMFRCFSCKDPCIELMACAVRADHGRGPMELIPHEEQPRRSTVLKVDLPIHCSGPLFLGSSTGGLQKASCFVNIPIKFTQLLGVWTPGSGFLQRVERNCP